VAAKAGEARHVAAAMARNRAREGLEAIMSEVLPAVFAIMFDSVTTSRLSSGREGRWTFTVAREEAATWRKLLENIRDE
jgi:hypothetical protein